MNEKLKLYITKDEPCGPIDTRDINPLDVKALEILFEQHNRIYRDMSHRPSIILGRKGSGKTAYLRTVYFNNIYDHITEIRTDHALTHISKVIQGTTKGALFTETLAELWKIVLWMCMLCEIQDAPYLSLDKQNRVKAYLEKVDMLDLCSADEVLWRLAGIFDELVETDQENGLSDILRRFDHVMFNNTVIAVEKNLKTENKKVVILMDSLDDFQLKIDTVSDSLKGLLNFVGSMNKPWDVVDVRFCLPAELYQRVANISSNPNKDFRHSIKLQWSATELIHIGAHRLMLYLENYYPDFLKQLMPLNPSIWSDALKIFHAVLPQKINHQSGFQEDTISYILRHTQLLPRHFLILLNSIFKNGVHTKDLHLFPLEETKIIAGVREVEARIVKEIFVAFRLIYPTAEGVCKRSLSKLEYKFSVGDLYKVYMQHGKTVFHGRNLFEFQRMLMEIGAIGRITHVSTAGMYIHGDFEYTGDYEISTNQEDKMCIHPLFSGVFGKSNDEHLEQLIYPYGSGMDDEVPRTYIE